MNRIRLSETLIPVYGGSTVEKRMRRRNRRGEGAYLKYEIIDGAYRLIREQGWANLSQRKIAAEVGVSPQSISSQFDSTDEIMRDVAAQGYRALDISLHRTDSGEVADLRSAFSTVAASFMEFARPNRNVYILMTSAHGRGEHSLAALKTFTGDIMTGLKSVSPEVQQLGDEQLAELVYTFWLSLHGVATADPPEEMGGLPNMTTDKAVDFIVDGAVAVLESWLSEAAAK